MRRVKAAKDRLYSKERKEEHHERGGRTAEKHRETKASQRKLRNNS
jgi:hypothetical protein